MIKSPTQKIAAVSVLVVGMLLPAGWASAQHQSQNVQTSAIINYSNKSNSIYRENIKILKDIKTAGQKGMVINSNFVVGDPMDNVYKAWGNEDKMDYVAAAKGTYSTYNKQNMVFGWNKGAQIFEMRRFDKSLKLISLSDIQEVYGKPQYNVINKQNQRVVGYKINKNYKVEFVLSNPKGDRSKQLVDHYGVLYPKLTANIMADDPGRQW